VEETIKKYFAIEPWNKIDWKSTLEIFDILKDPTRGNLKTGIEVDVRKIAGALIKLGLEKPKQRHVAGKVERGYFGIRLLP